MFVLLFAYVFGGAINVGGNYREYILGGILIQTLAFGLTGPGTAIATDLSEGVIDRFRSLPASRIAYVTGHYLAELAGMALSIAVLLGAGLIVGWRVHTDLAHFMTAIVLLLTVRVRDDLDRHLDRPEGAVARCSHGRRFRRDLSAHVPEHRFRSDQHSAERACSGSRR